MTATEAPHGLKAFRLAFGLLLAFGALRFFYYGWIDELYVTPTFHFTYDGFSWVKPWPRALLHLHFAAMGLAAVAFAVGWKYRASLAVFLALFLYVELLDKTTYLNHYYLVSIVCALMLVLPFDRRLVTVLKAQFGLVYFFAGVAKLQPSWLLEAQPLSVWLSWLPPGFPHAASWAAALMDLSAPFLLAGRRTRPYMFAVVVVFHLATAAFFNLGLFPWLMIAGAALFFVPSPVPAYPRLARNALAAHFLFQIAWPLRHHLYDGDVTWNEDGYRFAWHVMLVEKNAYLAYDVVDPATGRTWRVYPHDDLSALQLKQMSSQPDMIVAYAKKISADFAARGVPGVEVHADSWAALSGRTLRPYVDASVDLARLQDLSSLQRQMALTEQRTVGLQFAK